MTLDDEMCESCGTAIQADDLVTTADGVSLHRSCAREMWPREQASAERTSDVGKSRQVESCQHGTPWSQHCCNCHSGMLFLGQGCRCDAATDDGMRVIGRIGRQIRRLEAHRDYGPDCPAGEYWYRPDVEVEMASVIRSAKTEDAVLTPDDFCALRRIIEVLPVADTFLTSLQVKLSSEENRQYGSARHPSRPEVMREIERIEALIQSRLPAPVSPVEPTGASPQAETGEASVVAAIARHRMNHSDAWSTGFVAALGCCADDLPDEIVAIRPNRADLPDAKAYRRVYRRGFIEALARAAALVEAAVERTIAEFKQHPAPVSPVEPTPPTLECCACGHLNTPQQATRLEGEWRSSGEYVCLDSDACARRIAECSEPPVEPTPEPETCEWRYSADAEWWQSGCDSQDLSGDERLVGPDEKAKFCPYCGKPLRLVPSEETK